MILLRLFLILIFAPVYSCHDPGITSHVPACITQEIRQHAKDKEWVVGAIKEYRFQGKTVFAFEPDPRKIADGATTIKDVNCNVLCNVGGFAGPRNNQCSGGNFFTDAVYKRTIWERKD